MGIIQTGRVEITFESSGSGEAGVVILIRGQGTQLIHWAESFYEASLLVHGAGDFLIPLAKGKETANLIPGATFQLIDGMGHDIPPGLGKPLAEIVLAHIRSITNQTASH